MSLIDYEIDERFLLSDTLSFKVPASDLKVLSLIEDAKLELGTGDFFYITEITRIREDARADYEVLAEARWMRLADIKRVGNFTMNGHTPAEGLAAILDDTPWSSGVVTSDATTHSLDATDASVLDLIWTWAKICVCEVSFDVLNLTVSLVESIGATKPLAFRYGRNLTQIKRNSKAPACTRLFVYGRDDLSITALTTGGAPYIEDYTYYTDQGLTLLEAQTDYRKDQIYADDSFIDDVSLYNAAVARLAVLAQPSVTYECSVIDLSSLTGSADYDFQCGDTVRVYDGELDIDIAARVTRKVTRPYEPEKNRIELSFGDVLLPDTNISSSRTDRNAEWELFQSRNTETVKKVRQYSTILHRLKLDTTEDAEWVVGFKLMGSGIGSGTVTFTFTDDSLLTTIWNPVTVTVTPGSAVNVDMTYAQQEISAGEHTLVVRAISNGSGKGVDIAAMDTAFWVLAKGARREEITLPNSVRFDYTGAVQNWTVPPGVTEILTETVGASGNDPTYSGKGAQVNCKFAVTEGMIFDIYVGGYNVGSGANIIGGWPDGGNGATQGSSCDTGGGGSTQFRASGGIQADSWVIAGGGGGAGQSDSLGGQFAWGGDAGFYDGEDGKINHITSSSNGAHDDAPGGAWGGGNPGEAGDVDGLGFGGDAGLVGNFFAWAGGGGGGGWHGGGGAAGHASIPALFGGGGGGNCNMIGGYDLEYSDGYNGPKLHGYMIISWEDPDTSV